eukprot:jgi/Picsp_1/3996/NSC_01508-R1_---NA---
MSTVSARVSLVFGGEVDVSLRGLAITMAMGSGNGCGTTGFGSFVGQAGGAQKRIAKSSLSRNTGRMQVTIEARSCTPTTRKYPGTVHCISSARVKRSKKVGGSGSDDGQQGDENVWLYLLFFSGGGGGGGGGGDNGGGNGDDCGGNGDGSPGADYWMRDFLKIIMRVARGQCHPAG